MRTLLSGARVFVTFGLASVRVNESVQADDREESIDATHSEHSEVFDAEVHHDELEAAWREGDNGLCGAGIQGILQLQTGTHTGWLPFRVELHDRRPEVDERWDEIVEASFTPKTPELEIAGLEGDGHALYLPINSYRVRYSIRGMDDTDSTDEPSDEYLLQFWPDQAGPAAIVKVTSERAAYWHRARGNSKHSKQEDNEQELAREREPLERERWGERVPNSRLRATLTEGLYLSTISRLDIDLEFTISEAEDGVQRKVAGWATLRSLERAGLNTRTELTPAVEALQRGERVPAPFRDSGYVWSLLAQIDAPRTLVAEPPDGQAEHSAQDWAMASVFLSAHKDSLVAALETLVCLAFVSGKDGYRTALTDVRQHFPELDQRRYEA